MQTRGTGREIWAPLANSDPPHSAFGLIRREFTALALVFQAVWVLATPGLRSGVVGAWPLALVAGAWSLLLVAQFRGGRALRRWARWVDVIVCAAVAGVLGATVTSAEAWQTAASVGVLCSLLIGMLIDVRFGLVAIVLLVLLLLDPSTRFADDALPAAMVPAYVVAIGGSLLGVRYLLEGNARRIDKDTETRDEIERQQQMVEGVEAALRRQERLLHETVLNTLTAIDRGGLAPDRGVDSPLQQRCREAIEVLTNLESGAQALGPAVSVSATGYVGLGDDLLAFIDGMRADGIEVDLVADSLEDLPDRVRGALATSVREALINVARHSQARHVRVLIRVRRGEGVGLRVEIRDDGRGFDPTRVRRGFGLDRAIVGPMDEVGGSAAVRSRPGEGTRIVLTWQARPGDAMDRYAGATGRFALPAVATFGIFLAVTASLAWLQFDHPAVTAADVALVLVLGVLIAIATPEAPLPWAVVLTISALGPLFALLKWTGSDDAALGGGWALAAIAALFMVAAAIGPPWSWTVLLISWLVIEVDPIGSLLQPATVAVAGGAFIGRSLRRDTAAMERAHRDRLLAGTALEVTRESLSRLRARYGPLEDSAAIALLTSIADGTADPDDPELRRVAGLEEGFIRSLVRIDPSTDELRALVAALSRAAHARGVSLKADLTLPPVPAVVIPPDVAQSLQRAVAATAPVDAARLTARTEAGVVVVTLVAPILEGERDSMRALPVPGFVADPDDPADPTMVWETRLVVAGAP